ncbi:metallo-beta-lactamase family protein [Archangium gephyra]|uniref:Metallo-beta-lactamase family protein n=1 Tax=Archangium gephyra TaxID=48 RepID=A0AAC8Q8I7_9BACT|nr:MBL fold metallo-hydrolase [Archangium gephyra]AKJ03010.1 Metallo-beta-lactamase family protein, RNA-specific [Archangium gephyra]REG25132.1 metallo-beta-lactamase family protein [Archangium gephyra]
MASIHFLGAAGTVTGSKFLLEYQGKRVLIDCGLFQGRKELRQRNWRALPIPPRSIDAIVLTHAHIDHTGGLPRVVRDGFHGPVYCTSGTRDLSALLLPDSAHLQEEEARYANKEGFSKHRPALPLYSVEDAQRALKLFETFGYERTREILPGITLTFYRAGHILGSAVCVFHLERTNQRVVFTGDLGRYHAPILRDPQTVRSATTLVVESTYGDREHGDQRPVDALCEAVLSAYERKGMVVIPAFSVGRTQELLYHLRNLEADKRIPELEVFVDSPMACDATPIYVAHAEEHDLDMSAIVKRGESPLATKRTRFVTSPQESRQLNQVDGPGIIISASGMATGGRILHHLKNRLPDPRNTVLFVGYQSEGSRGRRMLDGEKEVKIHGQMVRVEAEVRTVSGFSAHADWTETLRWMDGFESPPRQTLLVHGEPSALQALKGRVEARGWPAYIPEYLEKVELAQ